MRTLWVFVVILSTCYASNYDLLGEEWSNFKHNYGKNYKSGFEERFRRSMFFFNKELIDEHNAKYEKGLVSFKMGMNQFGDLHPSEFRPIMNGFNKSLTRNFHEMNSVPFQASPNIDLPTAIDWRDKGAVTPVKNQGGCGSCWAFSATGSLEGQIYRKTGKLVSLSEQNLVDCSKSYGNNGCEGGLMDQAFQYVQDNKGIDTEDTYPYEALDGKCRFKPSTTGGSDIGHVDIPKTNEDALKEAIATYGPISVAIDASQPSFQFYVKGVYDEPKCSSIYLDHGVLAVGYGTESGKDYWLVKNSWGEGWGEHGYIKMVRNKNNQCGIATMASYPLV